MYTTTITSFANSFLTAPTPAVQPISQGHTVLMMAVALVCLLVLLLPLVGEASEWPSYLHVTVNQKLIAAFALGRSSLKKQLRLEGIDPVVNSSP